MVSNYALEHTFNVRNFGARGDGVSLDTDGIQKAIDACRDSGGGTVAVPAGHYVSGTLFLHSDIHLYLDSGAFLLGSQNPVDYPLITNRWEGQEQTTYAPLISGSGLKNVAVSGRGTIDGRGQPWWQDYHAKRLVYPRPRLIGFSDCSRVLIEGVRLCNSPSWTIHPVRCEDITIHGVTIDNPPDSPNTDGIDPDSCRAVHISDCHISAGDDCIAIKSAVQGENDHLRIASKDITITNCTFERGHGGVVFGSEMSGGIRNVVISNCIFVGTDRGLRFKSRRGRGGVVENVRATNLIMDGVLCPFTINMHYACGQWGDPLVADRQPRPVDEGTPLFRQIHISQVMAVGVSLAAGFVEGLAEMPVEDLSFSDVQVSLAETAEPEPVEMADGLEPIRQAGFIIRNVRRLVMERVHVDGQQGPAFDIMDSSQVQA